MESDVQAMLDARKPRFASVDNSCKGGAHLWAPTMAPIPDPIQVMVGRMSAGSLPPILLYGPALMSPLMPEPRKTHVATLRCGRVRLTTSGIMGLSTAVSQGAHAGAIPVGSYNYTESGTKRAALSFKSGNVPGQPPLSPMVTA